VEMFWQAACVAPPNQLPGPEVPPTDPRSLLTHVSWVFASMTSTGGIGLVERPDRVTSKVHLQPIGRSVLDDLVGSGDLDPTIPPKMTTYTLSDTSLVWTATSAKDERTQNNIRVTCVGTPGYNLDLPLNDDPQTVSRVNCGKCARR